MHPVIASPAPTSAADLSLPCAKEGPIVVSSLLQGSPRELEVGAGRGDFLMRRALVVPEAGLLGLEIRKGLVALGQQRLAQKEYGPRVRLFAEDATQILPRLTPDGVFSKVHIHFPDPWWKKRHQKRLLLRGDVPTHLARLLEPQGELFLQTDVEARAEEYERLLLATGFFSPGGVSDSIRLDDNPYGARSPREIRALAEGLPVVRMRFVRNDVKVVLSF